MSVLDDRYKLIVSIHYDCTSASAASAAAAASVTNEAVSTRPAAAAVLEANDPANAVVLVASSWPPVAILPDANSSSSYFDDVEPLTLQFTVLCSYSILALNRAIDQ